MVKQDTVSGELFALTYGAFVRQIIEDYENIEDVNKQLDEIGYNIGTRLVEEFLAKTRTRNCNDFRTTCNVLASKAFPMFLGITPVVEEIPDEKDTFNLIFEENPLNLFVELPDEYHDLVYSNLICGVIKGALTMLHMRTNCKFIKDVLKGDETNVIQIKLVQIIEENARTMYQDD